MASVSAGHAIPPQREATPSTVTIAVTEPRVQKLNVLLTYKIPKINNNLLHVCLCQSLANLNFCEGIISFSKIYLRWTIRIICFSLTEPFVVFFLRKYSSMSCHMPNEGRKLPPQDRWVLELAQEKSNLKGSVFEISRDQLHYFDPKRRKPMYSEESNNLKNEFRKPRKMVVYEEIPGMERGLVTSQTYGGWTELSTFPVKAIYARKLH